MKTTLFFFVVFSLTLTLVSCGGNEETFCDTLERQVSVLVDAVIINASNYEADSATVNCQKLKSSLGDLLIEAEKFRKCVPDFDTVRYDADVQDFEDTLLGLPC
jgi:hypothetical protein